MSTFSFGPFTLDIPSAELRRGNERIALRPKCFDVLVHLVEQRGKLVTQQELLDRIWADVVVDAGTVSRTIAELRAALDDNPARPQFIETVARRGYKFIAPLAPDRPEGFALIHGSKEYPLRAGSQVIGRGKEADIPLYTPSTSRRHARIELLNGEIVLTDLGSRHGTFVNGEQISAPVRLNAGDQIEIGGERLILWSPASETSPEPPSIHLAR